MLRAESEAETYEASEHAQEQADPEPYSRATLDRIHIQHRLLPELQAARRVHGGLAFAAFLSLGFGQFWASGFGTQTWARLEDGFWET